MVRRSFVLSIFGMLFVVTAHAGTLTNATWFQTAQGIPLTRTFAQLAASGSSTAASIAVNLSYPSFATTLFVPKTQNGVVDLAIQVTQGGAQAITATANAGAGTPGIPGTVIIMSAAHLGMGVNQSMFMIGANTIVQVPLSAGKAGLFSGTFTVIGQLHAITVDFFAWTPGTLQFTGLTSKGQSLPSVGAMGSFNLNGAGGGTVMLVSPSKLSVDGTLAQRRTVSFTKLAMSFVPEPSALLLLGAATLALGLGMRRG